MKRVFSLLFALMLVFSCAVTAIAADGNVIYDNNSQKFIFQPGSDYSLTDLFPNFKDVMPGDTLRQRIKVRNDRSNDVKVEIYIRSLGAMEGSEAFLSQLELEVAVDSEQEMAYMFDAYANETDGMTDWVCLGMLYSGGEVYLDVLLEVPVELGNEYQSQVGYLQWEFRVVEYPVEDTDPEPPKMGDDTPVLLLACLAAGSAAVVTVLIILIVKKKKEEDEEN